MNFSEIFSLLRVSRVLGLRTRATVRTSKASLQTATNNTILNNFFYLQLDKIRLTLIFKLSLLLYKWHSHITLIFRKKISIQQMKKNTQELKRTPLCLT